MLLASGYTPVYPCHVSSRDMRTKPVGTGPFKFVEFKGNESIKVVRNPDYWKKGRPYVDAVEWRIIAEPVDPHPGVRRRRVRHDLQQRRHDPVAAGREVAGAEGGLRGHHAIRQPQPDREPRVGAVQQSADPQGHGAGDRSQRLHQDPDRRQGQRGRRHAAAAGGPVGHAEGGAREDDRLRSRRREEPGRGAQDHGGPRLQRRQPAEGEDLDPRHRDLSRSGGDPDRPAQEDSHRRRARGRRHQHLARQGGAQGLRGRHESHRRRRRRSRRELLRELRLQVGAQLHPVLQSPRSRS